MKKKRLMIISECEWKSLPHSLSTKFNTTGEKVLNEQLYISDVVSPYIIKKIQDFIKKKCL